MENEKRGRKSLDMDRIQVQIKNYPRGNNRIISKSLTVYNASVDDVFHKILNIFDEK